MKPQRIIFNRGALTEQHAQELTRKLSDPAGTVAIIAPNGASAPAAITEQPSGMGKCWRCKTVPMQHIDRTPGAVRGRYVCKCPDGPGLPLQRGRQGEGT